MQRKVNMSDGKSALVVVDVQNGFVTEHSAHVVPIIADLVAQWQATGRDVVFTRYINYAGSPFERIMGWSKLKDGAEIEIVDELQKYVSLATGCIDKKIYTLFTDEGEKLVRSHGWTDLFICGIDTEVCVLKTAVDAFERDITPWILSDASASHAGRVAHDAGIIVAGKMIGRRQVIESRSVGSVS